MDHRTNEPKSAGFEDAFDVAADALADSVLDGVSHGVSEALSDPIVVALMAADKVDRPSFEALLRKLAAKLKFTQPAGLPRTCSC
jgi:hypothetical protein